ncbi:MAG: DUF488 family protein [Acidilobaceae archaeon]
MFKLQVYTLGYGGRSLEEFINILKRLKVEAVIDVRRWNVSRRLPDFSGRSLAEALNRSGIEYFWIPELGGYRRFGVDVEDHGIAKCFKSAGFRTYATYITMNSAVKPYLEKLVHIASGSVSMLLCREKYPWLCHRKILSDYLYAKGFKVLHVIDIDDVFEHRLSKCAVVVNGELRYV